MTIRQRKNLADKISKHLVTIKESGSNKFVYLKGKSLIDIVDGRYSLWTTCLGTFKQPVFCDLYIDDIDLLLKYSTYYLVQSYQYLIESYSFELSLYDSSFSSLILNIHSHVL